MYIYIVSTLSPAILLPMPVLVVVVDDGGGGGGREDVDGVDDDDHEDNDDADSNADSCLYGTVVVEDLTHATPCSTVVANMSSGR